MTIEEFIRRAEAQPIVSVNHEVIVPGQDLLAFMNDGQCHATAELNAHPDQRKEIKTFQYRHILGAGLRNEEIDAWQAAHADHPLSEELRELLRRIDGIHLWADLAKMRAYFGVRPLKEWLPVDASDWNEFFQIAEIPAAGKLVLSYHDNGDYVLCYNVPARTITWHDVWEFDTPKLAGSVDEFLELWWKETAWLDPRDR